jgi:hypothetical protein
MYVNVPEKGRHGEITVNSIVSDVPTCKSHISNGTRYLQRIRMNFFVYVLKVNIITNAFHGLIIFCAPFSLCNPIWGRGCSLSHFKPVTSNLWKLMFFFAVVHAGYVIVIFSLNFSLA